MIKQWVLLAILVIVAGAKKESDRVASLPNQQVQLQGDWYSGVYNVTTHKHLHYIFARSLSTKPDSDPIVVLFNGGPGAAVLHMAFTSGIAGLEINPSNASDIVQKDCTIEGGCWLNFTNLLLIDYPAGTGLSYAERTGIDTMNNDWSLGIDGLNFIKQFLYNDWPELLGCPLYLSGISYGGIHAPHLALRIHQFNQEMALDHKATRVPINLKGFIIGNGATQFKNDPYTNVAELAYQYGSLSHSFYTDYMANNCSMSFLLTFPLVAKQVNPQPSPKCAQLFMRLFFGGDISRTFNAFDLQQGPMEYIQVQGGNILDYMNSKAFREAFHVPEYVTQLYSGDVYRDVFNGFAPGLEGSTFIYSILAKYGYRTLHVIGDTDSIITVNGALRGWVRDLGLEVTKPWSPWLSGDQLGGFSKEYGNVFTLLTVHGEGHYCIVQQHGAQILNRFLSNTPF